MDFHIAKSEYGLLEIVWEQEPVPTKVLVKLCAERFLWKSTTTYTILRRLCDKEILQNQNSVVMALICREDYRRYNSKKVVDEVFDGSLPSFIAAFTGNDSLNQEQLAELQRLLDSYKEGKGGRDDAENR